MKRKLRVVFGFFLAVFLSSILGGFAENALQKRRQKEIEKRDPCYASLLNMYKDVSLLGRKIEEYRPINDKYPENLENLVPQYLKELPRDDFGELNESYSYFTDGNQWSIQSVGGIKYTSTMHELLHYTKTSY